VADTVIRVEGLGKRYRLRHQRQDGYIALRDVLADKARALGRRLLGRGSAVPEDEEEFWALRDVSFELKRGEVLGIIGRNGAGKSTLLKILSRITEPTEGRVRIRGRVASLLEVGTGFHPELTGRENIFLNGAILGMTRVEIRRKFDEIAAFAEVDRFLDTPVKRYSSGMYVRLAFAVAAHLEPEILVVDEVLAVGDTEFQKKCLGKMKEVSSSEGRTVLFVSHNLAAVRNICRLCILLDKGRVVLLGPVDDAVAAYSKLTASSGRIRPVRADMPTITSVVVNEQLASAGQLSIGISFESPTVLHPLIVGVVVYSELGSAVFGFNTAQDAKSIQWSAKKGIATLRIADPPLLSGTYRIAAFLGDKMQNYDVIEDAAWLTFISPVTLPMGVDANYIGYTRVSGEWTIDIPAAEHR